jgi:Domain of unknown function (DUF397)
MEDTDLNWRKATYSNGGENCIEVAADNHGLVVRDTQDRTGPVLNNYPGSVAVLHGQPQGPLDLTPALRAVLRLVRGSGMAGELLVLTPDTVATLPFSQVR